MKNTIGLFIAIIAMSVCIGRASDTISPQHSNWSYTLSHISMSEYYGSIVGGLFHKKGHGMSFTDVIATRTDAKGSTRVDLSIGKGLDNLSYNKDGGSELDLTVGRTHTFGSADFPVVVDFALCYLAIQDLRKSKNDVVSGDVRIDLPKVPFAQPYLVVYRFNTLSGPGSGWFVYGGFQKNIVVGTANKQPVLLGLEHRTGYSGDELFGTSSGLAYHRLTVSLTTKAGAWTITPAVVGQVPGKGQKSGRAFVESSRMFATISVSRPL